MQSFTFAILLAFAQTAVARVAAQPMSPLANVARDANHEYVNLDERPPHRVAVVITCIMFAFVLALAQGKWI
jgi:hypothetical protein